MSPQDPGNSNTQNPGNSGQQRKAWKTPQVITEPMFESKGMACLKIDLGGGPGDCAEFFGAEAS